MSVCGAKPGTEMLMRQGAVQATASVPDASVRPSGRLAASEIVAPASAAPDASSTVIRIGACAWSAGGRSARNNRAPGIAFDFVGSVHCIGGRIMRRAADDLKITPSLEA